MENIHRQFIFRVEWSMLHFAMRLKNQEEWRERSGCHVICDAPMVDQTGYRIGLVQIQQAPTAQGNGIGLVLTKLTE